MIRKKRKTRKFSGRAMLCISTIFMLNLIGVSYGVWNDNLDADFFVDTGYFQVDIEEISIDKEGDGDIEARISDKGDKDIVDISGWCFPGFNGNITLKVRNTGTVPMKYINPKTNQEEYLNPNEYSEIVKPISDFIVSTQEDNANNLVIGENSYELRFEQNTN